MPQSYTPFLVHLSARTQVSENLVRLTFTGPKLDQFGTTCLDQRIKLVLGSRECVEELVERDDWLAWARSLPEDVRPRLRTYTVKAVRPMSKELDVDFVVHGTEGPASAFAVEAPIGTHIAIVGPVEGAPGSSSEGVAWAPGSASQVLIAGDETAVPAISNIVESLDPEMRGAVFLEVPSSGDIQGFTAPHGVTVSWLPRESHTGTTRGDLLYRAVQEWCDQNGIASSEKQVDPDDSYDSSVLLWDEARRGNTDALYTWVAADADTVARLRHEMRKKRGLPKDSSSFMGYWRMGVSL
ncbi:siderophore-interacting protein [Brevibacterium sp. UMB1308A]|uniref:siderophore-interacting protein n=1 Tax=Brevibacterium sp. UMB1308A TaxID=3050608 RepID=UPI00254FEDEA|nr:siderophore-interacting protein [Brevibacterium sp. UMB1308A]MDK8346201.1 siderophore-interacting protein [Brevibacterium sp. UMB1308B]MDK8712365.1 siderophore-interacting protein [Brevibacterium sp. UMB1308A]